MNLFHTTFSTPLGAFSIAVRADGAVAATAFGDSDALARRLRTTSARLSPNQPATARARREVEAYFAGTLRSFTLPLGPEGTDFQHAVWLELTRIPFGDTRSYAEVARNVGSSPRAVGAANAANPVCLIVPCHRVIGADGSLTGFAFGMERKRRLLEHEAGAPRASLELKVEG
jgi:methylated-DNA-[protein]-cysteine S-methyltransferase